DRRRAAARSASCAVSSGVGAPATVSGEACSAGCHCGCGGSGTGSGRACVGAGSGDPPSKSATALVASGAGGGASSSAIDPAAPLAAVTVAFSLAGGFLATGGLVGQSFGLFGLDFALDIEGLFLVIGFLDLGRGGRGLRREQGLGRLQRVHLFAAVDDEGLLA